jgi:hypothetical protein
MHKQAARSEMNTVVSVVRIADEIVRVRSAEGNNSVVLSDCALLSAPSLAASTDVPDNRTEVIVSNPNMFLILFLIGYSPRQLSG